MGMVVRSNIMAQNANRQLGVNNSTLAKSLEKLASGFKINRAGDDASGLAISEKMKAQIKGLETAASNAQDGISLVQTAEGALTEVHDMLNRMVELADKSANGTIQDAVDREAIQSEVDALNAEINRISQSTNFNGINLLDGSMGVGTTGATYTNAAAVGGIAIGDLDVTVSGNPGVTVEFTTAAAAGGSTAVSATWSQNKVTISLTSATGGSSFTQADIDNALKNASGAPDVAKGLKVTLNKDFTATTTAAGTSGNILTAAAKKATATNATTGVTVTATKAGANTKTLTFGSTGGAIGAVKDAVTGNVTVNLETGKSYTASQINKMLSDVGAEMSVSYEGTRSAGAAAADTFGAPAYTLAGGAGLASGGGLSLQIGDTNDSFNKVEVSVDDMSATGLGVNGLDVSTKDAAGNAIQTIKNAINKVSTNRGNLGALQNRLEHTINNLDVTAENMSAANSRIRDTDMAKEMMNYTKMNVLTQAAQAMLAQANQQPQSILQLLQ